MSKSALLTSGINVPMLVINPVGAAFYSTYKLIKKLVAIFFGNINDILSIKVELDIVSTSLRLTIPLLPDNLG